jgi:lambda family phage portal protein
MKLPTPNILARAWHAIGQSLGAGEAKAHYDAGRQGRRMRGWNPTAAGPNLAIENHEIIRSRARDAARNEWAASKAAQVWATNLVGTGIVPRPATNNAALKARLATLWADWAPQADADGILDFYGLQTLAVRSWITAGELFIRMRARRPGDGINIPIQVQLLESEMCPMLDWDTAPGMPTGNRIKSGIEISPIGRRVAYWMYREHPGDRSTRASLSDLVRVPADQIRHVFEPLRPGQLRGVSDFATILSKLRGVLDFDDAQLERQRLANLFTMFVTRTPGADDIDPVTGQAIQYDSAGQPVAALEPGLSMELNPGEDVKFSEPPGTGAGYAEFIKQQLLGVSAGQGLPYELLTGDLGAVSDRALRVILQEFRRHAEQRQWQIIIPMLCQPVRDAWLQAAVTVGEIAAEEYAEARKVTWQPHGWSYIHPVQDVQGKALEVQHGFRSRASVVAERGDEVDAVDNERAADNARETKLKLTDAPTPPKTGKPTGA